MGKKRVQPRHRPTIVTRRRSRPGVCHWCRCSDLDPCPGGCGWADGAHRLCTACVDVAEAWFTMTTRPPNMQYAFFRGYTVALDDERADGDAITNPYPPGATARFWDLGHRAGARAVEYV